MLGIHRGPVNSQHKWPVTRKMFPFDDVIMWILLATDITGTYFSCKISVLLLAETHLAVLGDRQNIFLQLHGGIRLRNLREWPWLYIPLNSEQEQPQSYRHGCRYSCLWQCVHCKSHFLLHPDSTVQSAGVQSYSWAYSAELGWH